MVEASDGRGVIPPAVPISALTTPAPTSTPTSSPTPVPSPAPSLDCGVDGQFLYRVWLYDSTGDGWQGATYVMRNSSVLADSSKPGSVIVTSGTLGEGFEQADYICLADGCYELAIGGGSADSEIGFRFVDEIGGHFQDLEAPYSDHLCVAAGDVFDHPTLSPTISSVPSPAPTPMPTSTPTSMPTSSPTSMPSPAPTGGTRASIDLTIGLSGMTCDDYGSEEEAVVNSALTSVLSGVSSDSFSEHVCTAAGSRRALQATSIAISTTAAVDIAQVRPTTTENGTASRVPRRSLNKPSYRSCLN